MAISRRTLLQLATLSSLSGALWPRGAYAQSRGGILNVALDQDLSSLVPSIRTNGATQSVGSKIFQGLFSYGPGNSVVPVLAESIDVSDDGMTYTFRLRNGVKWHDGVPFTSADVAFSAGDIVPKTHGRTRLILENIESIETPDEATVVMHLRQRYLPFVLGIGGVNMPILPKHIFEGTDYATNPANSAPIGTGPFKFKEWRRGEYVHLVRNEDYYLPNLPYVEEIYFHIIPDVAQRAVALETGRANVALQFGLSADDENRLIASGGFKPIKTAYDGVGAVLNLTVNTRRAPFSDIQFRQAMAHALDRPRILDLLFAGRGRVAGGPFARTTAYYDEAAITTYEYSPEKAKALLDELGLVPDQSGVRSKVTINASNSGANVRVVEVVRQMLAEVGIELTPIIMDSAANTRAGASWEFDIIVSTDGQFIDPAIGVARKYLSSALIQSEGHNYSGYSNSEVDQLWDSAIKAESEAEAQAAYSQIQRILSHDIPVIPLVEREDWMIVANNVEGMESGPLAGWDDWGSVYLG